jgi:hypothetical protein
VTFYIDPRVGAYTVGLFVEKCWLLRARCACGHEGRIANAQLVAMPAERLVGDVVARLKCASCGGSEGAVDYLQDRSTPEGLLRSAPAQK